MLKIKNLPKNEVGFVVSIQDYLLYLTGLPSVKINDIIVSEHDSRAIVTAFDREKIEALMLDPERPSPGESFKLKTKGLQLPLQAKLLGRALNPLGAPLDGKSTLPPDEASLDLDFVAPGVDCREIVSEQLYTGITLLDTLLPIGKGQRELVIGEPRSGKSTFLLDVIANQKKENIICIYTAIGKSEVDIKRFIRNIEMVGAESYTIILGSTATDSAPLISITPTVALSIAERYSLSGHDVLLILDDLGTHAKYLREISLLSRRIPGRESYPGDIFYQHSHLVERAGNFNNKKGGGSITLLPVIETGIENLTNFIPTNLMAMTDGHLLFSASLRTQGYYPAIESSLSVTRVGHQTQKPLHKILADKIRSLLAEYSELERFGHFSSELTTATQLIIQRGLILIELLKQESLERIEPFTQILLLTLSFTPFFIKQDIEFIRKNKKKIITALSENKEFKDLAEEKDLDLSTLTKQITKHLSILEAACQS